MSGHLHLIGVCGTFMAGLARLAVASGHRVSGSDRAFYPPMGEQLAALGIRTCHGYRAENLDPAPDLVVIGNAVSRGNPEVEAVLERRLPYTSGAQWLGESVLRGQRVLAVAGTHGKTTTSAMLAWVLEQAGLAPGYLIGGVPANFPHSAALGEGRFFVIEADEYDTAFFDKRAKFIHYRPQTLVLNNLEFDHADIYDDLAAIERQFHHLVRCVPRGGKLLVNAGQQALARVLAMGCWSPVERFGRGAGDWRLSGEGGDYRVCGGGGGGECALVPGALAGEHNAMNALAALAAAHAAGVSLEDGLAALRTFAGVRRRLEHLGEVGGVLLVDDFAHHPTAIAATLEALAERHPGRRRVALLALQSNSMRAGVHRSALPGALARAAVVILLDPGGGGAVADQLRAALGERLQVAADTAAAVALARELCHPGDLLVSLANGDVSAFHRALLQGA